MSVEPCCVVCRAPHLDLGDSEARCRICGRAFEVCRGIPVLLDGPVGDEQRVQAERWQARHEGTDLDWGDRFDPAVTNLLTLRNRRFLDRLALEPGAAVIEVGCSTGKNLRYVAWRTGATGCGVDIALAPLLNAVEKSAAQQRFFLADAQRLPFEDGSFTGLLALDVLEHLPDPRAALREWGRVVRSDGVIALSVPVTEVFPTFAWWRRRFSPRQAAALDESLGHQVSRFPRPEEVTTWMVQVGLRPVLVEFRAALFEPLWDFLVLPAAVSLYTRLRPHGSRRTGEQFAVSSSTTPSDGGRRRRLFERLAVHPGRLFSLPDRLFEALGRGSQIYVLARKS